MSDRPSPFLSPDFTNRLDGYSSHLPMLAAALAVSSGPVLELGTGIYSTPLLHAMCAAKGQSLLSVEFSPEWYRAMLPFQNDAHWFDYIDQCESITPRLIARWLPAPHWGLVLIDQEPGSRRAPDLVALAPYADLFVLHDTENPDYGYDACCAEHFTHKIEWRLTAPWTRIVSKTDVGLRWIQALEKIIPPSFSAA